MTQLEAGLGDAAPPRPVPTEVTAPASAAASAPAIPEWTDQQEAEYSRLTQALAALNTELDGALVFQLVFSWFSVGFFFEEKGGALVSL